jgi:hypothetical protein
MLRASIQGLQLGQGEGFHPARPVCRTVNRIIMHHHNFAISAKLGIQLYCIGMVLHCLPESSQCILGGIRTPTAMRKYHRSFKIGE